MGTGARRPQRTCGGRVPTTDLGWANAPARAATDEDVLCATAHGSLTPVVQPGDVVAMHWDWICDVLNPQRLDALHLVHHADPADDATKR